MKPITELNEAQRQAVTHGDGPLLVVAGAGTGKTGVLTARIAWLIREQKVPGHQIVAMTFTERATREMEDRLFNELSFQEATMRVGTFHAFGRSLLEQYAHHLGRSAGARLIKRPEQIVLLTENLNELPLKLLKPRANPTGQLNDILNVISRLKNEDVSPAAFQEWVATELAAAAQLTDTERPARQAELAKHAEVAGCFAAYEELKLAQGLLDYDDQLTLPLQLLREHPDVLQDVRRYNRYVLVDEFQDTNVIQAELAYLVSGESGNLMVVGDDDQSIYAFRAASLSNILEFEHRHPAAKRVILTENYRSTQPILDAAYRLIKHNDPHRLEAQDNFDKRLTAHEPTGPAVQYWQNATIEDEADRTAELLKAAHAEGVAYREMAILIPTHRDGEPFRQALNMSEIPVSVGRREFLYHRLEVKLALAALRVLDNPLHSSSLRILATSEVYGFPLDDYAKLERTEARTNQPVWEQLAELAPEEFSEPAQQVGTRLRNDIERFRTLAHELSVGSLLYAYLVEHLHYLDRLAGGILPGDTRPIDNLSIFFTSLKRFADTAQDHSVHAWLKFFDHIADLSEEASHEDDLSTERDAVSILTVHAAKGLEFELVVLPVMINARLPGSMRGGLAAPAALLHDPADREAHIREQRRLCYVAITRAKRQLYLSFPNSVGGKRDQLKPSPFIAEALGEQIAETRPESGGSAATRIARLRRPRDLPGAYHPPDPLVLSHSSLEAFRECPWRYYWDYHVRVYLPPQAQLLYGDAVHNTLRDINRQQMEGTLVDAATVQALFEQYWRPEGYVNAQEADRARDQALRTVLSYAERSAREPEPTAIEQPFKFKLSNCYVTGRYDRIDEHDGRVRISDYKTSQVTTQEEAEKKLKETRNRHQLLLYALAYRATHGKLPAEVALHFPEHYLTAVMEPKEKALETLEDDITTIAQRILDGDLKHNPAPHECSRAATNRCPTNTERNRGDFS